MDIELKDAVLLWTSPINGDEPGYLVARLGSKAYDEFDNQAGACISHWREFDDAGRLMRLMIEAWHAVVFDKVPAEMVHKALLVIPEYRAIISGDCLPDEFRHERE